MRSHQSAVELNNCMCIANNISSAVHTSVGIRAPVLPIPFHEEQAGDMSCEQRATMLKSTPRVLVESTVQAASTR